VVKKSYLKLGPYCFEQVNNFKYLGVYINGKNNMHNEIRKISWKIHGPTQNLNGEYERRKKLVTVKVEKKLVTTLWVL